MKLTLPLLTSFPLFLSQISIDVSSNEISVNSDPNCTYYLQESLDLNDDWDYTGEYLTGDGNPHTIGITTTDQRKFFRYVEFQNSVLENTDTDGDNLSDAFEIQQSNGAYNPFIADTDNNGVNDGDEDLDGDNLNNAFELNQSSNIYDPLLADTNGNDVIDGHEDLDGDEHTNYRELIDGTSLTDSTSYLFGAPTADYSGATTAITFPTDSDEDGLSDDEESLLGSNANNKNTDSDHMDDSEELKYGTDPTDACSNTYLLRTLTEKEHAVNNGSGARHGFYPFDNSHRNDDNTLRDDYDTYLTKTYSSFKFVGERPNLRIVPTFGTITYLPDNTTEISGDTSAKGSVISSTETTQTYKHTWFDDDGNERSRNSTVTLSDPVTAQMTRDYVHNYELDGYGDFMSAYNIEAWESSPHKHIYTFRSTMFKFTARTINDKSCTPFHSFWLQRFQAHGTSSAEAEYSFHHAFSTGDESETFDIIPSSPGSWEVLPFSFSFAPNYLSVNSDFDEGNIDSITGMAIPDCDDIAGVDPKTGAGNTAKTLKAKDGGYGSYDPEDYYHMEDLSQNWFGVFPGLLDDEFWDGATVYIRKINQIDPDTGYPESGHVRFYNLWDTGWDDELWGPTGFDYAVIEPYDFETLEPVNLVTGGVPNRPEKSVYGQNAINGSFFYMEGVRPGKITLEWSYEKGDLSFSHQQTFTVATRNTKEDWQQYIHDQIMLESELDMAEYEVKQHNLFSLTEKNFLSNIDYIQAVYKFYERMYCRDEDTNYWAGMAKVAGATVYGGMNDMQYGRIGVGLAKNIPQFARIPHLSSTLRGLQDLLITGNIDIFNDLAWQFAAYNASGIQALEYVAAIDADDVNLQAWKLIDEGKHTNNRGKILAGNKLLLEREQKEVLAEMYGDIILIHDGLMDKVFSEMAENPFETGSPFRSYVPGGSFSTFEDRWQWIENDMLNHWTGASATKRKDWATQEVRDRAKNYSLVSPPLPVFPLPGF